MICKGIISGACLNRDNIPLYKFTKYNNLLCNIDLYAKRADIVYNEMIESL